MFSADQFRDYSILYINGTHKESVTQDRALNFILFSYPQSISDKMYSRRNLSLNYVSDNAIEN